MRSKRLVGLIVSLATIALTFYSATHTNPDGTSGIEGQASVGPTCPVEVPGQDCADKPYRTTISVYAVKPNTVVPAIYPLPPGTVPVTRTAATFKTSTDGRFRVSLNPGIYVLRAAAGASLPILPDTMAVVKVGEFTQVELRFDSGIR